MKFRFIHKFPPANVGDSVRVTLPDVDRGRADPKNILFAVVAIEDEQYYKLGNKYGTLPQLYTRNQFGVCPISLIPLDEVVPIEKSLREIAGLISDGSGGQGYKRCSCKDGTVSEWKRILDVNVIALSVCSREAVRSMNSRNLEDAHIIHLSSNLAHYVPSYGPFHFYSATKHAVRALTEGLRQELRALKSSIKVTCLSPGLVKSSIFKNSLGENFDKHIYEAYPSISPADIASTIEFVLATPPHVQVQDIIIKPIGSEA
ncbi:dehydrogenase/reductase SDR family member 11-like isoform X2 [Melanaphis sacchari]|uniref:dehydrogenase/reductase SDR family member 11-like isoform X2 n=1 Tax=Melanaphis sacchari TaxID=742174 RepID=UPI000DC13123|nr:dehydrogenase/reductase SDR family member 11-like isoform X2 [Melanaphis sacchari]